MIFSRLLIILTLAATLFALACADELGSDGAELKVVTTVSPITSIAENIGGERIAVEGIVPEGVNSHTFEPAPSVARLLSEADLIVVNGLFLEQPTLEMAEANKKADAQILLLGDNTITRAEWAFDFSFPESEGHPNPHLWPDPMLGLRYAELIHGKLLEMDPDNKEYYDANLSAFRDRIEDYDAAIKEAVASIPSQNRKLLTYHDSWAYFARRYGMEVVGAAQPADFSEPSAGEVADLIDQVRELQLPAVFGSEVFPSPVLQQIANEGGAEFVDSLRDDDLPGAPGDPRHSYLGLISQNMEIMVEALEGDTGTLSGLDPSPVFEGESGAVYPQ
jgi:ABC-type Zn uptake system ZnuABC Zn-binding protein ZnuA